MRWFSIFFIIFFGIDTDLTFSSDRSNSDLLTTKTEKLTEALASYDSLLSKIEENLQKSNPGKIFLNLVNIAGNRSKKKFEKRIKKERKKYEKFKEQLEGATQFINGKETFVINYDFSCLGLQNMSVMMQGDVEKTTLCNMVESATKAVTEAISEFEAYRKNLLEEIKSESVALELAHKSLRDCFSNVVTSEIVQSGERLKHHQEEEEQEKRNDLNDIIYIDIQKQDIPEKYRSLILEGIKTCLKHKEGGFSMLDSDKSEVLKKLVKKINELNFPPPNCRLRLDSITSQQSDE